MLRIATWKKTARRKQIDLREKKKEWLDILNPFADCAAAKA